MNNIYVDELPKNCEECPCLHTDEWCAFCNLKAFDGNNCPYRTLDKERHKDCPLKLISDRLAEERKKVIDLVRENYGKYDGYDDFDWLGYNEFLDQIERGTDETN